MAVKYISDLQRFVGKVCTVFTLPINRDFKQENPETYPKPLYVYFMGAVESIDEHGIMLQQTTTGLNSYIFLQNVVSISEEETLDPNNPHDAEIIERYKTEAEDIQKEYEQKYQQPATDSPYVDVEAMSNLSEQLEDDMEDNEKSPS